MLFSRREQLAGRIDPSDFAPKPRQVGVGIKVESGGSGTAGPPLVLHGSPLARVPRGDARQLGDAGHETFFFDVFKGLDLH